MQQEFKSLREKIAAETAQRRQAYSAFELLMREADRAYKTAAAAAKPRTVLIGEPKTPFGSQIDLSKPIYVNAEGSCGFAWLEVHPGTCRFARWLVKVKRASHDSYAGGVRLSFPALSQSIERAESGCAAAAKVLRAALPALDPKAQVYEHSRED